MKTKSDEKNRHIMQHENPNITFFSIIYPGQSQSLFSPFNILPPSAIFLLAPSDVKYLLLLSWCLEIGNVLRTELRPQQLWGSTMLLEDQLMSRWRECLCLGLCWDGTKLSCAVTLPVLLKSMKKVVAMSDEYHRFSKFDLAFCL